jgi:Dockerin type I domain
MKRPPLFRSLIGAALLCAAAFALCAAVETGTQPAAFGILYVVDSAGDGDNVPLSGTGCTDSTGHCTLRAAIRSANNHSGVSDTISFDLPVPSTINLGSALPDVSDDVTINGPGAEKLIVQRSTNAATQFRVFNVTTTGTVSFSGLTIANGQAPSGSHGGGIRNVNAGTVNVTNCVLSGNSADFGGGIDNGGTLNLTNTTLTSNTAGGSAGGILNGGTLNLTNTTLAGNSAGNSGTGGAGGGIDNSGILNVTNSTLTGNSAKTSSGIGGGISNNATANVTNSTLSGNSARLGGGINNASGTLTLTNSTLSSNSAQFGGAISNNATANVTNSTLTGNTVGSSGGGIYNNGTAAIHVKSTIVALNTATSSGPDVFGSFDSHGYNLIGKTDGSTGFVVATDQTGTVAAPLNPKLDPSGLQDNGGATDTIALLTGSPAIDKGTSNSLTGTLIVDQRGVGYARRIDKSSIANAAGGDGTDIGAFEFGAQIKAVSRKTHGMVGMFDVKLPLTGPKLGVECRKGGTSGVFKVILTFPTAVTVTSASVTPDPAAPGATGSVSSFSVSSSKVTVNLTGVSNAQTILVNLFGVSDGTNTGNVSVPMGVLLGDTNKSGSVTSSDVTLTQSKVGQTANSTNFREDVTLDGTINSSDVQLVQSKVGTKLP